MPRGSGAAPPRIRPGLPAGDACCGGPALLPRHAGRRPLLLCAALASPLRAGTAEASGSYAPLPRPLELRQVPGSEVYYTLGHPGVPAADNMGHTSNAGFVVTEEGVIVFDALGTPSLGWALLQKIREVTPRPVRYVVISHYHADHIYGLQAFRDHTDAVVVAQRKGLDYTAAGSLDDEAAEERLAQRRQALAPWVDGETRIVLPGFAFQLAAEIRLGGKRLQLLYAGPAHSMSDTMMLVQPDGVLFAGDIVQNGRIPFMASAVVNSRNWLRGLDQVASLAPRFTIPGHGQPSADPEAAIAFTRDYILHLRRAMGRAVAEWQDFDTAYAGTDWSGYDHMPAFAASNRGNAYRVFLEMEQEAFGQRQG
ncbi:MBL fold metallo-hydrolase [Roseicella aquatilis]|uniref:MBL fold metallo-hydrolase n=1 Tax=Roseicella aquatilis TaxID=2527868 RepID=A0A4R4D2D8_9PROT|nr:MBL fold metallo-hydrolase [Roseicella aquatilis]TCZ52766.1 MBL fold metallo-hydrolase [Roseicella aquatilis]